jgi:hypothetical protein
MNSSLWSASRTTHIKIVAVSLVAAMALVTVGMNARMGASSSVAGRMQADGPAVKAGAPVSYSANEPVNIR